jgi:hypothetical protein
LLRWSIALTKENCEGRGPLSASQGIQIRFVMPLGAAVQHEHPGQI